MRRIFLIRNGESKQNIKENYSVGLPNHLVELIEKGKEEAKKAGMF